MPSPPTFGSSSEVLGFSALRISSVIPSQFFPRLTVVEVEAVGATAVGGAAELARAIVEREFNEKHSCNSN